MAARAICRKLLVHCDRRAASRAVCTAGNSKATRTPIMAITTSSSTSVKPVRFLAARVMRILLQRSWGSFGTTAYALIKGAAAAYGAAVTFVCARWRKPPRTSAEPQSREPACFPVQAGERSGEMSRPRVKKQCSNREIKVKEIALGSSRDVEIGGAVACRNLATLAIAAAATLLEKKSQNSAP